MTPSALEKKLVDVYAPQMDSKQVMVQVVSSSFRFMSPAWSCVREKSCPIIPFRRLKL